MNNVPDIIKFPNFMLTRIEIEVIIYAGWNSCHSFWQQLALQHRHVMFLCSRAEQIRPRNVMYFLLYEWSFQTNSFKII